MRKASGFPWAAKIFGGYASAAQPQDSLTRFGKAKPCRKESGKAAELDTKHETEAQSTKGKHDVK